LFLSKFYKTGPSNVVFPLVRSHLKLSWHRRPMIGMPKPSPLPVLVLVAGILCCDFSNFMCVCCYSGCLLLNLCDISDTLLLGLTLYLWCH
jgi:hypothetical protein